MNTTELWECDNCAFGFDARHTDANGEYSCPSCGERQAEERVNALLMDLTHVCGERDAALSRVRVLEEALTPSGATKAAFIGEFRFTCDEGHEVVVPWTTVKEIMAAIRARALSPERMPSDGT